MSAADIQIQEAQLADQGRLGEILIRCLEPTLAVEVEAGRQAGQSVTPVREELLAADDFYFSSIDLMNCCYFARAGEAIVGAAAVNPYLSELQYLAVLPEFRRQGLGRRLVEACGRELRRRGAGHLKADCSGPLAAAGAEAFFLRLGFCEVRRSVRYGMKL